MMKQLLPVFCAALAFAALAGCGGGGAGGGIGAGSSGGPITSTQRAAAFDAAKTYYATLPHTSRLDDAQAMAAFLKKRPEFEASGVAQDGTAWARFTDGRMFLFVNNRAPAPQGARSSQAPGPASAGTRGIPTSRKAYVLSTLGTGFQDASSDVAGVLASSGYNLVAGAAALSVLRTVKQAGVFYINTHGGAGTRRDGRLSYCLGTSDVYSPEDEQANEADLAAGRLAYMQAFWGADLNGNRNLETHYAITTDFVTTYFDLKPAALVFLNACSSSDPWMSLAIKDQGGRPVLSWTRPVLDADAAQAARFFFDRVAGTNMLDPKLDPPQRPFDVQSVYDDLVARGMGKSDPDKQGEQGESHLELSYLYEPDVDLLAPTIMRLQVVEEEDTLYVAGSFGPDPGADGKVTMADLPLTVKSWTKDMIACQLPDAIAVSSGTLRVEVRGHRSNPVKLTDWRPTFTFTYHNLGTMQYTVAIQAHIRLDAQTYRFKPGEAPRDGEWPFTLAKDSKVTINASGSYTDQVGNQYTLKLNPAAPEVKLNGPDDATFSGSGRIITQVVNGVRTLRVGLNTTVKDATLMTIHMVDGTTMTSLDEIRVDTATLSTDSEAALPVTLDDSYGIKGDKRSAGPLSLEWGDTPCGYLSAPDPKASRSPARPRRRR